MGGLLRDLSHPYRVLRRIKIQQCRGVLVELVTQHNYQVS